MKLCCLMLAIAIGGSWASHDTFVNNDAWRGFAVLLLMASFVFGIILAIARHVDRVSFGPAWRSRALMAVIKTGSEPASESPVKN